MSFILYYSNFCNHSQNIIQELVKSKITDNIHFINIDNRVKENNQTYIILENNKKIILPEAINRVPALMNLNNYNVYFGEDINMNLKNTQEKITMIETRNNLEPIAFSLNNNSFSGIVSDNFSFLDTTPEELTATGNGGVRQLHQYVKYDQTDIITNNSSDDKYGGKNEKLPSSLTIEQLQKIREKDFK